MKGVQHHGPLMRNGAVVAVTGPESLKKGNLKCFSKIYLRVNWRHLFLQRYPVDCFVGLLRCK